MGRQLKALVVTCALLALAITIGVGIAAATAPTVSIDAPSSVSYTSAHLSGKVDPEDQDTYYYFQYTAEPANDWTWQWAGFDGSLPANSGEATVEGDLTGLKPSTEYSIRLVAESADGQTISPSPYPTFTTDAVGPAAVTIDPPSSITSSAAHFSGTIDPEAPAGNPAAFDVEWHFECTPACPGLTGGTIPADSDPHTVEADATGLKPGTAYEVTLVATNAGGPASTGPESFATETTGPEVVSQKAFPTATEATLQAQVNPGGLETTYYFEYGPTASYGTSTPMKTLKAGGDPVTASAPLFGLEPSSNYHFRIVVTNSEGGDEGDDGTFATLAADDGGSNCGNEAIRIAQRAEFMPQCRAYEMVSPADKNGHGVEVRNAALGGLSVTPAVSTDGERVLYGAQTAYADAQGGMPISYLAQRTQSGWGSVAVSPRVTLKSALAVEPGLLSRVTMSNPSLTAFFGETRQPLVPDDTDAVSTCKPDIADFEPCGLDMYQFGPNQRADLLSQGEGGVQTPKEVSPGEGISADGSHAFFLSGAALVSGDSERTANAWDVYERSGGVTRPLNRTTAGGVMVNRCGSRLARVAAETEPASPISADGSRVVFQVPNGFESNDPDCGIPQRLYVRVDDSKTLFVNESQRSEPDPAGLRPAEFLQMSRNGSDIYFNSEEMLTDDSTPGGGLYHFDVDSGELELLLGSLEFPGEVNIGFLKVAPDGSKAYFGTFTPPPPGEGEAGESFLYEWDGDAVHWVASSPSFYLGGVDINTSRKLSADNRYLRLVTSAQLTAFDNEGFRAVYLYDSVERALTCVSCDPAGQRPVGSQPRSSAIVEAAPVLNDGSLVFESGDQLVAADTNLRRDVYEYRDGRLHLLSSGSSPNDVFLFGQSADGRDVFLATNQRLTLSDRDHALDIFDARAGGGFVEQSAPPPDSCQGDGCQRPAASAPTPRQAGSAGLNGPGNQKARRKQRCPKGMHRKKARNGSKARCVKNKSSQHNSRKGR